MLTARLKELKLTPGAWVLDLGCGEGRHVHGVQMIGGVNVVGVDIDRPSIEKARTGTLELGKQKNSVTDYLIGDAYNLPFEDDTFDAVICSEVLEHLDNFEKVIGEIRRVSKPASTFCASVPHAWVERICWRLAPPPNGYPYAPGGHIRIFDDTHLRYAIERKGFKMFNRHHAHGLHAPYWWLKCLFWNNNENHPWIKAYHKFLVWDLLKQPVLTRVLEAITAPIIGKSVVMYFNATNLEVTE